MRRAVFSPAALIMALICAVVLFALSVLLPAFDDSPPAAGEARGASSFSASAIGQAGFYDVLRRLGRPVTRSVGDSLALAGGTGALILAEPDVWRLEGEDWPGQAPRLLLVLPKWRGHGRGRRPNWIDRATLRPLRDAQSALELATEQGRVVRRPWPPSFTVNELPFTPSGSGRIQLIHSEALRPVVAAGDGLLVGEIVDGGRRIWVLSDPDVMNNQGLGRGQNAAFMVALTDALRAADNGDIRVPLVFDETAHGFRPPEWSPLKLLFRFPFAVVTGLALFSALLMLLAGGGRFGAARPAPRPLDFGQAGLIANGARLLEYAGHQRVTLKSYIKMILYSSALALHAPGGLSDRDLAAWLDRLGRARKADSSCAEIMREASEIHDDTAGGLNRLYKCARRMYKWKGDIL